MSKVRKRPPSMNAEAKKLLHSTLGRLYVQDIIAMKGWTAQRGMEHVIAWVKRGQDVPVHVWLKNITT